MVNPGDLQVELDVLEEKIETIEHLIKGKKNVKSDVDNYLVRKLSEYKEQHGKLSRELSDMTGSEPAEQTPGRLAQSA